LILFLAESPINAILSLHALPGDAVVDNVRRRSKLTLLAFELPSPASLGHGISAFAALLVREAG